MVGQTSASVAGIDEMILQVNPDLTIGYLNSPMAQLLGIEHRRSALGDPLSKWDRGELGDGVIRTVVDSALTSGKTVLVEWVIPGLRPELLPVQHGPRPAGDPVLRFVANAVKKRVEVVVQDVSRLRWLEDTFARYVAPEVIEQMLMRPEENFMEMERRELTVLFADLRGFTRITQELEPRVLQEMINEFLSAMVACIDQFGGTVDKFVGDEVMAMFGAPIQVPDHSLRGLLAAVEMREAHRRLQERWSLAGLPAAGVGIGVTTGEVFVGNVGTENRMDYTALGHWVNLAARLCGSAEAGQILTVPETYHATAQALKISSISDVPRLKFSPEGKLSFKNVNDPVTVLSVTVAG